MKTSHIILLSFLAGVLCAGVFFLVFDTEEPIAGPVDTSVEEGAALGNAEEVLQLVARIDEKNAEIASLKASLSSVEAEADEDPVISEEEAREMLQEARRGEMARRMEERYSRRAKELAETLGLNEAQEGELAAIYRRQFDSFRARRSGEAVAAFNFDAAVEGVLTDEQFEKYLETSQEQIYNRAEEIASTQVGRMAQTFELSPAQESSVYEVIHTTAQEMMISTQTGEAFDMRQVLNERLSEVLTPDQMSAYESVGGFRAGGPGRGPPRP